MRGNVEEGRETYAHGTFINGFHEIWPIRHAEEAFGFARVGQTIVNVPDNKTIKLYVDDEPLLLAVADLRSYERALDFRDGVLTRDIIWRTPGRQAGPGAVDPDGLLPQRHLAIMTFEVTMLDYERAGGDLLADAQPAGRPRRVPRQGRRHGRRRRPAQGGDVRGTGARAAGLTRPRTTGSSWATAATTRR